MLSLVYILSVFLLILFLSRRINLGAALFAGGAALAALTRAGMEVFFSSLLGIFTDLDSLGLVASILLILILSEALKAGGQLERLVSESKKIFHDIRLTVFALPALVGFLPMPGGAHFSAPMVDSAFRDIKMSREKKSFANYWFRHVWEYIMPIYPGIVAASALSGIPLARLIRVNVFLTLAAIISGAVIVFSGGGVGPRREAYGGSVRSAMVFLRDLSPVLGVVALAGFFGLDLNIALVLGVTAAFILGKQGMSAVPGVVRAGMKIDIIIMLAGILFFRNVVSGSGAVDDIAAFMKVNEIGVLPVVFGLSFLSGLVTGITIAFVGITFPIILSMMEASPAGVMFVFASGFAGVLLSPVHLCLVLSNRYFGAGLSGMYRYLLPAAAAVIVTGLAGYMAFG